MQHKPSNATKWVYKKKDFLVGLKQNVCAIAFFKLFFCILCSVFLNTNEHIVAMKKNTKTEKHYKNILFFIFAWISLQCWAKSHKIFKHLNVIVQEMHKIFEIIHWVITKFAVFGSYYWFFHIDAYFLLFCHCIWHLVTYITFKALKSPKIDLSFYFNCYSCCCLDSFSRANVREKKYEKRSEDRA